MSWQKCQIFDDEYYVIGWKLTSYETFPHCPYLAADTETLMYYNNEKITSDEVYKMYCDNGVAYVKENIGVRAYAFMLSDGENFVLFKNAHDFLLACAMFNVRCVYWYNARFDFSIFDYYFLTNGWTQAQREIEKEKEHYRHLPDKTYQSLNGDYGQRYQMQIWKEYKTRKYNMRVHKFKMIDICNIFGGGLAKNLKDFDIVDNDGNKVRKLKMDYDNPNIDEDIDYMVADTKGLYLLAKKINDMIYDLTGLSLFGGDYMTAGGLAKRALLKEMFGGKKWDNIKLLHKYFPITMEQDKDYREKNLYLGGLCIVNPYKKGKVQRKVYKYDVNSMYPTQMRNMLYPTGNPEHVKSTDESGYVYIMKITNLNGQVKQGKIPVFHDRLTGEYARRIYDPDEMYIWLDELEELTNWYDLTYDVVDIIRYKGRIPKGCVSYVDKFYDIKKHSTGSIKQGAKLFLNSAYGKWAQRPDVQICTYEMSDKGYVHLVRKDMEMSENSLMSVVVGSRITALARVSLLKYIRDICQENVKGNFIYCDTDSVHSLTEYKDTDDSELGKMKCEGIYNYGLYLAPKTYIMYENLMENTQDYEVHCKGVNTEVIKHEVQGKPFSVACEVFRPNRLFKCLQGINVKGGKALICVDKMIVNEKNIKEFKKQVDLYDGEW